MCERGRYLQTGTDGRQRPHLPVIYGVICSVICVGGHIQGNTQNWQNTMLMSLHIDIHRQKLQASSQLGVILLNTLLCFCRLCLKEIVSERFCMSHEPTSYIDIWLLNRRNRYRDYD